LAQPHGRPGSAPFPGAASIVKDFDAYRQMAPDIISTLRLDAHESLLHLDYLHVVRLALPRIEAARAAPLAVDTIAGT
jgi:hypothetical protein